MPRVQRSPPRTPSTSETDPSIMPTPKQDDYSGVTQRDKRRRLSGDEHDDLTAFKLEMKELFEKFCKEQRKEMGQIRKLINDIKDSSTVISDKNSDIDKNVQLVSEQIQNFENKITKLEEDRKSLIIELSAVKNKCEDLERLSLKTTMQIRNVPKISNDKKQDWFQAVDKLSKTLNVNLNAGDIRDVYRIADKKDKNIGTLFVELSNTLLKQEFLTNARKFNRNNLSNKLSSSHLGFKDTQKPIFVSECLTARGRRLFFLARDFAQTAKFDYCWTSNGRVFLREKEGSHYILVKDEEHLNTLKKTA